MSESLPQRLERVMREAGYNPRSLSLSASLGETAVRDIVEGRIASPRFATLQALAKVLGVGVEYLAAGEETGGTGFSPASGPRGRIEAETIASPLPTIGRDLPVFGAAQGGDDGAMVMTSEPMQSVSEPLLKVASGYGVFIVGESMSPAYEQGDIALVNPALPHRRNSDVILTHAEPDGTEHVLIKRLVGWTDENWQVRQYNPAREFDLPRAKWTAVKTIVGKYHGR